MKISRKDFIAVGLGGVVAALSTKADAQLVEKPQDWASADLHKIMQRSARYRQVYDIIQIGDGVFLNNIKNSLNGFQFSFGARPSDINIVAALHGPANLLNFDDAMWKKYRLGEFINLKDPRRASLLSATFIIQAPPTSPTAIQTAKSPSTRTKASRGWQPAA